MPRIARAVVPGFPHHVSQRGNRGADVFLDAEDRERYLSVASHYARRHGVDIWAYCLMPDHVHLVLVPETEAALTKAVGQVHHRYTKMINFRQRWKGHLWQGRYASYPMDEKYMFACVRYIEMNPVRANLVEKPEDWQWSSARYHLGNREENLIADSSPLDTIANWKEFLNEPTIEADLLRKHERTGRPLGNMEFIEKCSIILNRDLAKQKPGPKGPRKKRRNKRVIK